MIQKFTVYDPETGMILRSGFVADGNVESQAAEGEALLVGVDGNWQTERVDIEADPPAIVPK